MRAMPCQISECTPEGLKTLMILKLDPTKSDELTPLIQAARGSENLVVSDLAEQFIAANWRHSAA